ncbi:MAG: hypothetical protein KF833_22985 [Verrucomicrobiae bacterium]|nr:hypothetical protein [Verrucomicrobiae bacterium]
MSDLARTTLSVLRHTAVRLRLQRALDGLWRGLLLGAVFWLVLLAAAKALPLPPALAQSAWLLVLLTGPVGFALGGWCRVPLPEAARLLERRLPLAERLTTALELASTPSHDSHWTRLVADDADRAARAIDPRRDLPLSLPVMARWIPAALALVIGLGWVPEYRSQARRHAQHQAARLQASGQDLSTWVRRDLQNRPPPTETTRETLEELAAQAEQWGRTGTRRDDPVRHLALAVHRLEEEARLLAASPTPARLRAAAQTPSPPSAVSSASGPSPIPSEIQPVTDRPMNHAADLHSLAGSLDAAQAALDAWHSNASPSARQDLERALDSLASAATALGLDAAPFNPDRLPSTGSDPAAPMSAAAQALQAELDRLTHLQRLAETIETLEQAQRALLNDRRWRPSSPSSPSPSSLAAATLAAPSASDGDGSPSDPGIDSPTASSGGSQPGLGSAPPNPDASAPTSDRPWAGQTELTRIPGALLPEPNPLTIPLPGPGLGSPGSTPYRQAAQAAQSDARHALNQDRIPRAYRNAVRSYFEELP